MLRVCVQATDHPPPPLLPPRPPLIEKNRACCVAEHNGRVPAVRMSSAMRRVGLPLFTFFWLVSQALGAPFVYFWEPAERACVANAGARYFFFPPGQKK